MPTVEQSDRYKTMTTAFGCVDRLGVDFARAYSLFNKIQEQYPFKDIYTSSLPFVYVEGDYRKFKYFEKEVSNIGTSIFEWDETFADDEFIAFIGEHITEFLETPNDLETVVLSIHQLVVDDDKQNHIFKMKIDIFDTA